MESHLVFDKNIFEKIDCEEKAYWLGFLYADGCIHQGQYDYRIELGLAKQDYNHLVKYKNFIGKDNKISFREKTASYRYSFRDKKVHSDLINLGCVPNKSLILKFPSEDQVPHEWLSSFMRGYFDGDGSLWESNNRLGVSILSSYDFLNQMREHVKEFANMKIGPIHKELPNGGQRIGISGKKAMSFLDWIYKDAAIYLDRKYFKYLNLCHPYQ